MTQIKLLVIISLAALLFKSCRFAEKTDYIFPKGYSGWAIVIYNTKGEKGCLLKNDRIQAEIPENGILFTSNKRPKGILDNSYFTKDKNGNLEKIYPSLDSVPRSDSEAYYILVESYQSLAINKTDYLGKSTINSKDEWVNFDELVVFKVSKGFSDTSATKEDINQYVDSIKKILVNKIAL